MKGRIDGQIKHAWLFRRPFLFVAICYMAGILAANAFYVPLAASLVAVALFLLGTFLFYNTGARMLLIALMIFFVGISAYNYATLPSLPENLGEVTLKGRVDEVSVGEYSTAYTLSEVVVQSEQTAYHMGKRILLNTPDSTYKENDYLVAFAELRSPSIRAYEFAFDDETYLLANNVASRAWADEVMYAGSARDLKSIFYDFRENLSGDLDEIFENSAPLAKALLLGIQEDMSEADVNAFRESGLSHLLVVSGLHLTVLAHALMWLLRRFYVNKCIVFAIVSVFLICFVLLTGAKTSIVRAALMYFCYMLIKLILVRYDGISALSFAFLLLVFPNPAVIFDVGFQLSFAAVMSIMCLTPLFSRFLKFSPRKLWQGLASSAAATLGTAPLIINLSNKISPLYILFNVVAVPLASVCLPLIIICLILYSIFGYAFEFLFIFTDVLLEFCTSVATIFGDVGSFVVPSLAPLLILTFYVLILLLTKSAPRTYLPTAAAAGSFALCVTFLPTALTRAPLEIRFLDVGSADAIHISCGSDDIIIDTAGANYGVSDYIIKHGIFPDATIITHSDDDHSGGLETLAEQGRTGAVYTSPHEVDKLLVAATPLYPGEKLEFGDCSLDVLDTGVTEDLSTNENSLVMLLTYKGENVCLFTGDAEQKQELNAISGGITAPVLKVAHHGSNTSTSTEFVRELKPQIAVVSNGEPIDDEVAKALEGVAVYETLTSATITLKIDDNIVVEVYDDGN